MISNVVIYEMALIDQIAYKWLSMYTNYCNIVNYFVILKVYNPPLDFDVNTQTPKDTLLYL